MNDPAVWTLIGLLGAFAASMVAVVVFALTSGFHRIENGLGRLDDRVGRIEGRLGRLDDRVGRIEGRLGRVEDRLGGIEGRLGQVEGRSA